MITNNKTRLALIWLFAAIIDRIWFFLDNSVPAWDQSAHLSNALNYWHFCQNLQVFNGEWWSNFWQLSTSYRGPFVYILTIPFLQIFAQGYDQSTLVNLLFTAIIIISVYVLGKHLFNPEVGLWSAGFCVLFPSLVFVRTDYLIDYGLTSLVILTFTFLTFWKNTEIRLHTWLFSLGFAVGLGLIMLTKPTGFFFIFFPSIWFLITTIFKKRWERLLQILVSLIITWLICGNWYGYNWLTIITSALAANRVGIREGDPGPNSLAGWLYYGQKLPEMLSFPLLLIPLAFLIISLWKRYGISKSVVKLPSPPTPLPQERGVSRKGLIWLGVFCLGSYILCSLGTNKDIRFVLPFLPGLSLILAYFLTLIKTNWAQYLRWGTVGITSLILIFNLFINGQHLIYTGKSFPHTEVMDEIVKNSPYLYSTVGVVANNTGTINAFTFDFYGKLADFKVYSRELPSTKTQLIEDARSFVWYINRTKDDHPNNEQLNLQNYVQKSTELKLFKTWQLPEGDILQLFQNKIIPVVVEKSNQSLQKVRLESVKIQSDVLPGKPVNVSYKFTGSWQELQEGIVLLTWQGENNRFYHDHAIGLGRLYLGTNQVNINDGFAVTENLSMLPPAILKPGIYTLKGVYLHRQTGVIYDLQMPLIQININPNATTNYTPELDLVSKLQLLGSGMRKGDFDQVFNLAGYYNLYDALQDYLVVGEKAFNYRINQDLKGNLDLAYGIVLTQVLQKKVKPVLLTLDKITKVDDKNAYVWAYLGFIHLYNFHPKSAELVLNKAESLNPNIPEVKTLKAIARIMQFKF